MVDKIDSVDEEIVLTGEDNPEETEVEDSESSFKDKLKTLRQKLKRCEAEKAEHLESLQRAKAEFLNAKKRQEEALNQDKERISDRFISSLVPLCDSFDMAMGNTAVWEQVDESWRSGVASIKNQLDSILSEHGVTIINPINEPFDPERHDALSTTESEHETDTVVEVVQKGYERNGHVIRPAKVILSI